MHSLADINQNPAELICIFNKLINRQHLLRIHYNRVVLFMLRDLKLSRFIARVINISAAAFIFPPIAIIILIVLDAGMFCSTARCWGRYNLWRKPLDVSCVPSLQAMQPDTAVVEEHHIMINDWFFSLGRRHAMMCHIMYTLSSAHLFRELGQKAPQCIFPTICKYCSGNGHQRAKRMIN